MRIVLLLLVLLCFPLVYADHSTPERIAGDHVIILSVIPGERDSTLKFFMRDMYSGKAIEENFNLDIQVTSEKDENFLQEQTLSIKDKMHLEVPTSGVYHIIVDFQLDEQKHSIDWSIWVPGVDGSRSYPIGVTELSSFGSLLIFIGILTLNYINRRKSKNTQQKKEGMS